MNTSFENVKNAFITINGQHKTIKSIYQTINGQYKKIYPEIQLITFYIDGNEYQAEEGMTFDQWCNSKYNINEMTCDEYYVYSVDSDGYYSLVITGNINYLTEIESNYSYSTEGICCFKTGTQITISLDGKTQPIETLKKGDLIISYNTETKENYYTKVKELVTNSNSISMAKVYLNNGTILDMTDYHPLYTIEGFKSITNKRYPKLEIGDILPIFDNKETIITNIELYKNENPITTYTLDIIDLNENIDNDLNDNYYANGIIAHNANACEQQ